MSGKVEQAVEGLRRMIATGELSPGARLPSENDLCNELDVSRSSLREAQKMLGVAGVLNSRPGSGTFVSQLTPEDFMSGLRITVPLLPLEEFLGLCDVRAVLEGHAAAQAAARLDDAQTERLVELAEQVAAVPWTQETAELDNEFHELLVSGAHNASIAALLAIIRTRGRHYRIFDSTDGVALKAESDESHRRIAEAVRRRDTEAARLEAMNHVMTTRRWLEGYQPRPEPASDLHPLQGG